MLQKQVKVLNSLSGIKHKWRISIVLVNLSGNIHCYAIALSKCMIHQCGGDGKARTLNCLIYVSVCLSVCVFVYFYWHYILLHCDWALVLAGNTNTLFWPPLHSSFLPFFLSFFLLYDKSHHITQHNTTHYHTTSHPCPYPHPPRPIPHHTTHHHTIPHHTILYQQYRQVRLSKQTIRKESKVKLFIFVLLSVDRL